MPPTTQAIAEWSLYASRSSAVALTTRHSYTLRPSLSRSLRAYSQLANVDLHSSIVFLVPLMLCAKHVAWSWGWQTSRPQGSRLQTSPAHHHLPLASGATCRRSQPSYANITMVDTINSQTTHRIHRMRPSYHG
jgi:hypothetical protein